MTTETETSPKVPGYERLDGVLQRAYHQASRGKGLERHANNLPFHEQDIAVIGRKHGLGFNTGQAEKKTREAHGMLNRDNPQAAIQEILGAIVYLASAVMLIEEIYQ
jgi:hypothetical protein